MSSTLKPRTQQLLRAAKTTKQLTKSKRMIKATPFRSAMSRKSLAFSIKKNRKIYGHARVRSTHINTSDLKD